MTEADRTAFCPHCGNVAPQRVMLRHSYQTEWYDLSGQKMTEPGPDMEAIVCICRTCNELLVYDGMAESECGAWPPLGYPDSGELHKSVPSQIRAVYAEAARVKRTAPNAFAVMLRRALEALCDDRGVDQGALAGRLRALADRGEVPPLLAEVSDVVRILGNMGAHSSEMSVSVPDTWALDDFFKAIVEYVYVAPGKLKDFKGNLKKVTKVKARQIEHDA